MALTLAQAAVACTNMLQRGVIETFIDESPVLARLPFMNIEGNAYQYTYETTLPGVAFRDVNEAYVESSGEMDSATETLKIFGGDVDVDKFIIRTRSKDVDQRAVQTRMKTKAEAIGFTTSFFEGDATVNPKEFSGLRKRITVASQLLNAGVGGATLTLAMMDDLVDAVNGDGKLIFAPIWLIRKVNALLRATGQTVPEPITEYGKTVFAYEGVPMIPVGLGSDGATEIIAFDETDGAGNFDTASMYCVRLAAEEAVSGLQNGGIEVYDLGELETKPVFRTRIEWYVGLGIFDPKSCARLRYINKA